MDAYESFESNNNLRDRIMNFLPLTNLVLLVINVISFGLLLEVLHVLTKMNQYKV